MRAEFERIREPAYCLRVWPGNLGYGDPYVWAATARLIDDDSMEVMGVTVPPTGDEMRAILDAAARLGCYRVGSFKIKPDRRFMRWHPTPISRHALGSSLLSLRP